MEIEQIPSSLNPLLEDIWAFTKTETLLAAFELGLFEALVHSKTDEPQTLQVLASQLKIETSGLKRLLKLLQIWGYVTLNKEQTTVLPSQQTQALFGSEIEKTGWLAYATYIRQVQAAWGGLTSTLQQGTPTGHAFSLSEAEARFSNLNEGLQLLHNPLATALFSILATDYLATYKSEKPFHFVDVGAGSGVWSLPFLKAFNQSTVTFLDYPSVLTQAQNSAILAPFKSRMRLISCDFESSNLEWQTETIPPAQMVLIANVLRELSQEGQLNLLKKAWQQLEWDGIITIIEDLNEPSQAATPLVSTVADLHLLATSFSSTGCLTKNSLTKLCQIAFEQLDETIEITWLELPVLQQQGLFACVVKKTNS